MLCNPISFWRKAINLVKHSMVHSQWEHSLIMGVEIGNGCKVELYKYKYITSLTKKCANVLETIRRGLLTTEKVVYQAVTVYSSFAVIGVANRPPDLNLNCGAVEVGLNVIRVVRGGGAYLPFHRPWLDPTKRTRRHRRRTGENRRPPVREVEMHEWCRQEQQLLTDRLATQHRSRTMAPPRFEEQWLPSGPDRRYAARP